MDPSILNNVSVTFLVMLLVSLLQPLVEKLPVASTDPANTTAHGATLRLLALVLNRGALVCVLAVQGRVALTAFLQAFGSALIQTLSGHGAYQIFTQTKATTTTAVDDGGLNAAKDLAGAVLDTAASAADASGQSATPVAA
jgi:hypothetical protein